MEFFSKALNIFHEKSLRSDVIQLMGLIVLAKFFSSILLRSIHFYLNKKYPSLNKELQVMKTYSPWLFIFFIGLFLSRPLERIFQDSIQDVALIGLRITLFTSGVMLITRSLGLFKIL